jgi:hypothetical protein
VSFVYYGLGPSAGNASSWPLQIPERHCHGKAAMQRFQERFGFAIVYPKPKGCTVELGRDFLHPFEQLVTRRR